jgi:aryl-alcohol dehydrogenase-like predicted oxidoreductase
MTTGGGGPTPGLALGTVQLGKDYGVANRTGAPGPEQAREILEEAVRAGVECLDTAPNYGESQRIIGRFLRRHRAREPWLITKVPTGQVREGDPYPQAREILDQARAEADWRRPPGFILQYGPDARSRPGLLPALVRLKEEGLAGEVGLSAYGPEDVETFLATPGLGLLQAPFNLMDQRLAPYLPELSHRGSVVMARSVYLQGLFFLDPDRLPPFLAQARGRLLALRELCAELGRGPAELALAAVRDTPGLTSLVVGVESREQLRRNLELMRAPPLPADQRERVLAAMAGAPAEVINPVLWGQWK